MDEIVTIELFGEKFSFKPDGSVEDPWDVADYLKEYVHRAEEQFKYKSSNKSKLAILLVAAMDLTRELRELKKEHSILEDQVQTRISSLMKKIDEGIQ
ncbi:MAG: cell division protein ZapA [Desulfobacteraceae bacterium]